MIFFSKITNQIHGCTAYKNEVTIFASIALVIVVLEKSARRNSTEFQIGHK